MLEDYIEMDLRDRASLLRKKTFILQGEEDRIVPPLEALKLHSLIKGSKLITLPGGHFPAEDERSLLSTLLKVSLRPTIDGLCPPEGVRKDAR
ncbi:MAG: hypothetical protein Q9N34_03805 [Aquificota bacterium]|nr:hypothetical protein [Aquificota bacterium]